MAKDDWEEIPLNSEKDDWQEMDLSQGDHSEAKSPVTAATTGLIQGAVPFAGAIAGAGKTAMDAITGVRGPLAPGGKLEDLAEDYRQARDSFTGDAKIAAEANPGIALASNVAGGLANPLFKGADTLPKAIAGSAAQAAGMSDADLTKGELRDTAIDAGIGAGAGALGYGVGKAIPKLWEGTKYFGKKALTNLGPSGEAIEARLAGKAQDAAKSYPQLAEDMGATLKDLGKQTSELDTAAWNTLSTEPEIPKMTITHALDDELSNLGIQGKTIGATDKQVSRVLNGLKNDLNQLSDHMSESDLKGIIKKLDDNINWDDQSQNKLNDVLEGIRTRFDQALKFRNPRYKKAMDPVAERTALLNDLKRQFNFKGVPGEGMVPTDTTAGKIQSSLRENKAVTQGNLEKLKNFSGKDYSDSANDYRLSQQFQKTGAQGSKRTNIGAAIGAGVGGLTGGFVGAGAGASIGSLAGGAMDAYGGKVAGKLIDGYLKAGNSAAFGKFAPVIKQAAEKGPAALAMMSAILSKNPEFRKQMNLEEGDLQDRRLGSH